jgi:hypothetical protein
MKPCFRLSGLSLGALLALSAPASAQSTNWTAGSGDWGVGSNWSAGEPTAGVDAVFNATGMATVTLDDEVCRGLLMGAPGGALLDIGSGSLTVDHATVGMASPNVGASISTSGIGNPFFTVTHTLTIGRFADVVAGGGTITVGTSDADSLVVLGTLQLMGSPTIAISNLAMRDQSVLSTFVLFNGFGGFISAGTAVLNGTFKVFDFAAPNGTYEVLRAESIVGTFDAVELPATGDWSWRIEGNSVFVSKGPVPVEATTWSGIKAGRGRE